MIELLNNKLDNQQARIPRMRTIKEAARALRETDENTAMTEYHIRRLCLEGVLPTVKAGKKHLLNYDTLIEYLENPTADKFKPLTESSASEKSGAIRRIPEKG